MSARPQLVLFDDQVARDWEPFALTRPAGELLFGCMTLRERAERALGLSCAGYRGCDELAGFEARGAPPVLEAPPPGASARLYLCSRAVPQWRSPIEFPDHPAAVCMGDQTVGWFAPAGSPDPAAEFLRQPEAPLPLGRIELAGRCLRQVWELVTRNVEQLHTDFAALRPASGEPARPGPYHTIGTAEGWLRVGADVTIEPGVVLDFTNGPIWLDDGSIIRAFTRLAGPAYIGPHSALLGGTFSGVSVGPRCKVHGELEDSVILGYSNKAHAGFLGHSYVGSWVNLGALTVNSDLKNNYGTIRLWTPHGVVDTGEIKIGCLIGDHVKTGIGSLIGTGAVIGAGSNLFAARMTPPFVPPFSWGTGPDSVAYDVDRFLETAALATARRGVRLSDGMQQSLRRAWLRGRAFAGR